MESNKTFAVSIDEIRQNFVFGDIFSDSYTKSLTMSDGSVREIVLRPMMKNGHLVVQLKDGNHVSYMGPNGTTTNGKLMINLTEIDALTEEPASSAL